ncbi:hypothetical protein V6Z11_D01G053100 [Gossypium hirsutum]
MTKATSWMEGTNCCLWDGVNCDPKQGITLFLLSHLRQLNLAGNTFNMSPMASQFGQLTSLTHLNISGSGFSGKIPLAISHLSELLSGNYGLIFEAHVFENVEKTLTQLRHLHLSNIDMSSVVPTSFRNMSSDITTRILEENGLQGKFPEDVFHFPYLQKFHFAIFLRESGQEQELELKFSKTNWSGPLKSLQVRRAYLQELPDSIGDLRSSEILDLHRNLSSNNFGGPIPCSVFNLTQVQFLDFSGNKLVGSLPSKVSGLSQLRILRLHHNFLSYRVLSWLFTLPSLVQQTLLEIGQPCCCYILRLKCMQLDDMLQHIWLL